MREDKDLMTAQSLAEALGLSVETIWRYTREKRIPFVALGNRQYRYRFSEVLAWLAGSSVREQPTDYQVEPSKPLTYCDYRQLQEEPGYRYEILDGALIKEPAPIVLHQRVSRQLFQVLYAYFAQADPAGEVFFAPLDITLGEHTVVQPDIFYLSGEQAAQVLPERIDGPPTLVVEVLSPSTRAKDRVRKLHIYQQAKVPHCWLVSPEDKTFECFSLQGAAYAVIAGGQEDDLIEPPGFPRLTIRLRDLW